MAKKATPGATGGRAKPKTTKPPTKDTRSYHYEYINGKRVRVYDGPQRSKRKTMPNPRPMRP